VKGWFIAIVIIVAAIAADQHYYYELHTDGALSMFRQIRHSLGW
jgi:hypothetical protein